MNILLTRLDRVGDLVLSTPAIASVRRSWPNAHVTIVCSRYNAVVVERNPDLDAVIATDEIPATMGRRFRGRCDVAIALAPRTADFRLVGASRAPVRVGYTYVRRRLARLSARLYLSRLGISEADPDLSERDPSRPVRHEVDQVLDLVRLAGGTKTAHDLLLPIDDEDRAAVAAVPAGGITVHLAKRWFCQGSTFASVRLLVAELRRFGCPIVVTYGDDARAAALELRETGVVDALAGELAFARWAAVFEKSRLVLTVDTGATHVASAVRRPTVVLFEHRYFHLSSQEWSPYRVPSVCLRKPASDAAAGLAASRAAIVAAVGELLNESATSDRKR
ncbi:MAG: glycosyltransferase family 9 protein [Candidatus Eremiobacteraeota bacterium]|nr:glycosyltransferase family 9 protein [Candidatus Eremiobacteraeota bacterium]MBC5804082.1 glycosyltransferase family 9 protein [Candidatus Eremiobacteraeota bacterium]MBC5821986.1 glycosyltransferase family 9 protein [Candidatus Eremiobacteraeota bacterium]